MTSSVLDPAAAARPSAPAVPPAVVARVATRRAGVPETASAGLWFALTAGVLAGIAPLLLIASTPLVPTTSGAWPWAWVLTVVVGTRYGWVVAKGERRLFELIFWLFTYVFLGLAPLAQMRAGRYAGTTPDLDTTLNGRTMLVVFVGTAACAVGLAAAGRDRRARLVEPVTPTRPVRGTVATHRLLILTSVGIVIAAYYASKVGVGVLFTSRAQRTAMERSIWPDDTVLAVIKALATLPLIVSFVALVRLRDQRRAAGGRGGNALPLLVLLTLFVVVNPFTSPRYVIGTALLALVAGLGVTSTTQRLRLFALLLAAGLVLVFPYADATRRASSVSELNAGPAQSLSSSDFDAFDQLNNMVAYVRDEGTVHGRQLTGAALFFVPRSVWSGKPEDTGIVIAKYRGYSFRNLSAPLVGEFFLNGGWPLLVLGMGGVGFALRRLDQRALVSRERAPGHGVLASVLPFYLIIVLRGSLLQSMAGLSVIVVSAAFINRWRSTPD